MGLLIFLWGLLGVFTAELKDAPPFQIWYETPMEPISFQESIAEIAKEHLKRSKSKEIPFLVPITFALLFIFARYLFKAQRNELEALVVQDPYLVNYRKAVQLLKKMKESPQFNEDRKAFFCIVGDCNRIILESKLKLPLKSATTEEIYRSIMRISALSIEEKRFIKSILDQTDAVKFANYTQTLNQCLDALENISKLKNLLT